MKTYPPENNPPEPKVRAGFNQIDMQRLNIQKRIDN